MTPTVDKYGYVAETVTHSCGHETTIYFPPELRDKFVGHAEATPCAACGGRDDTTEACKRLMLGLY